MIWPRSGSRICHLSVQQLHLYVTKCPPSLCSSLFNNYVFLSGAYPPLDLPWYLFISDHRNLYYVSESRAPFGCEKKEKKYVEDELVNDAGRMVPSFLKPNQKSVDFQCYWCPHIWTSSGNNLKLWLGGSKSDGIEDCRVSAWRTSSSNLTCLLVMRSEFRVIYNTVTLFVCNWWNLALWVQWAVWLKWTQETHHKSFKGLVFPEILHL